MAWSAGRIKRDFYESINAEHRMSEKIFDVGSSKLDVDSTVLLTLGLFDFFS